MYNIHVCIIYMLCLSIQHGESVCNLYGKIGGDSPLSHRGEQVGHNHCVYCECIYTCVSQNY